MIPSTAARESSREVRVPARALSRTVEVTKLPSRMEREVDLLNSETREATELGSSVGPLAGEGRVLLRVVAAQAALEGAVVSGTCGR